MDLIKMIFSSPAGSFSFVLGIMLLSGWLIYMTTKKVTEINADHGVLTKTVNKIEAHIDDIRKDLSYMKGSIEILKSGANPLTKSQSPISLTDKGKEIALELKAEEIIGKNWDKIFKDLEKNIYDKNAYDIQQYCLETSAVDPEKFFDSQSLSEIKMYAFKKGNTLSYYSGMFGIIIRDKYLQIKGIDVSEVDDNDPEKK